MKKILAIFSIVVISLIFSSISFAGIALHERAPIENKLRFTSGKSYAASFSSVLRSDNLNYSKLNIALIKHLSQESEKKIEGNIWENTSEIESELVIIVRNDKHFQIAEVGISVEFFAKDGEFTYRIGELQHILEQHLGDGIYFEGFWTTKPAEIIDFIHKDDDFIVFKP